jgi:CheY-like chemotaxis protein
VLLVDDDAAHVRMRAQVLGALGYEAVPHGTGAEALEAFRAAPGSFAAVVTDQMMPGMTGAELAAEALRIRPDTPIILCTGYSETLTPERAREIGIREYLRKPVAMRSLAEALCRATGRAPGRAA